MHPGERPEAIDTRLVFRVYAWLTITTGIVVYSWPLLARNVWPEGALQQVPAAFRDMSLLRVAAAGVAAFGCCAAALAAVDDPVGRRRGLYRFAAAHLLFGVMFFMQWFALFSLAFPPLVGWAPLIVGSVLLYLAVTGPGRDVLPRRARHPSGSDHVAPNVFRVRTKRSIQSLRSQYDEQIRQAARLEERAGLARDLHDAVKQQLFVIQTASATAQARFDTDLDGARAAIDQVRSSAREAMTEMEAMLEQLQAAPLENAGLVASLKRHCEALGFRTGAHVDIAVGTLPPNDALAPGTRQALFRVAQEALSNVARHARARNVWVSLGLTAGQVVLEVRDDGAGFKVEGIPHGMGLASMAVRASEAGGNLDVTSAPDGGTTVRFSVPCEPPSVRRYALRALGWGIVLIVSVGYLALHGLNDRPWEPWSP